MGRVGAIILIWVRISILILTLISSSILVLALVRSLAGLLLVFRLAALSRLGLAGLLLLLLLLLLQEGVILARRRLIALAVGGDCCGGERVLSGRQAETQPGLLLRTEAQDRERRQNHGRQCVGRLDIGQTQLLVLLLVAVGLLLLIEGLPSLDLGGAGHLLALHLVVVLGGGRLLALFGVGRRRLRARASRQAPEEGVDVGGGGQTLGAGRTAAGQPREQTHLGAVSVRR